MLMAFSRMPSPMFHSCVWVRIGSLVKLGVHRADTGLSQEWPNCARSPSISHILGLLHQQVESRVPASLFLLLIADKLLKFSWVVLTMSLSMVAGLVCACPTEMREFKWHSCSILQGSPLKSGWTSFPASRVLSFQDAKGAVVSYIHGSVQFWKVSASDYGREKRWRECMIYFFYSPLKSKISSCKCH